MFYHHIVKASRRRSRRFRGFRRLQTHRCSKDRFKRLRSDPRGSQRVLVQCLTVDGWDRLDDVAIIKGARESGAAKKLLQPMSHWRCLAGERLINTNSTDVVRSIAVVPSNCEEAR